MTVLAIFYSTIVICRKMAVILIDLYKKWLNMCTEHNEITCIWSVICKCRNYTQRKKHNGESLLYIITSVVFIYQMVLQTH